MAKKKLNKKVAVVGSIFLALFAVAAIWVISYKLQGPQKFIEDGDAAIAAKDNEKAIKQYARALNRAKDNATQKKIYFKLADTHILNNDWRKAMACWSKIATIDTSDKVSRNKLLDFYYDMADNGQGSAWKIVGTTADELLAISPEAKFYVMKGRAKLELAKGGEVADKVQALNETVDVLTKAQKLDPKNPAVYRYLAEAWVERGQALAAKGTPAEKNKAQSDAQKLLEKAIAVAPNDPNAYLQLLNTKLFTAQDKKQLAALESDYVALTKKFPKSPEVFASLAFYYRLDPDNIDKAVAASQKAVDLTPQSAKYTINAADIYYRKGATAKDDKYVQKATEMAKNALKFQDANDNVHNSREFAHKMNKLSLNTFLAQRYIEQILALPGSAPKQQKDALIVQAEQAVHEISQIVGSGENSYVVAFEGMLAYAKGDTAEGIRKMYAAYTQLKQADPLGKDAQLGQLSYVLANAFVKSSEIGATRDFLLNSFARRAHETHPEILLTTANVLLQLRDPNNAMRALDIYENLVTPSTTSKLLRVRATIDTGKLDDAQALLTKIKSDDPNVTAVNITLLQKKIEQASPKDNATIQVQIDKYRDEQTKLAQKLLQSEPNATDALALICEVYITKNKVQEAKTIVNGIVARSPNNTIAQFYKLLLAEPAPDKVAPQRRIELSEKAAASIPDPVARSLTLADYYRSKGIFDKALAEYKKAIELQPANKMAIGGAFDTALAAKDLVLAEQFAAVAKRENIDQCGGQIFMAQIAIAKKDYKDAISRLDNATKERPVFSLAYVLRSNANFELGNEQLAIEDTHKAIDMNPLDGTAAKSLASILYQRNIRLGQKVSTEQKAEAQDAIRRAYLLNPREWQILSFYAEYIGDTDPAQALSIRQSIQKAMPTAQNAAMLGNIAVKVAAEQKTSKEKKAYMDMAGSAYEQGYKLDPNDPVLLKGYADYLSAIGKTEQADQILSKASNKNLLWVHQIQKGQFEQAKEILGRLYKENPKATDVLKGLMLIAENTGDAESVTKYSQELLSLDNAPENQLGQIEALLQVGLIESAQKQLASFKEKYPTDKRSLILEAWLAIKKGQFTDAIELINKNLELKPNDTVSWNLKGQVDFSRGNYDDAINDFKKAKGIAPNMQVRTNLTRALLSAGRNDEAISELVSAIEAQPETTGTYFMLEKVYGNLGKADALGRFYADTIKQFPENPFWYNRAASFAMSQKKYDGDSGSLALSKKALDLSEKPAAGTSKEDARQQARVALDVYLSSLLAKKQYDQIVTYGSQYVDTDLAFVAFANMADAKAELGDKTKAAEYYSKALLKAASEDAVVFNMLQKMSDTIGRDETAKWCTQQLKATPDSLPINLAMCRMMRTNKETAKALTYVDKCLQIVGDKSPSYRNFIDTKQGILLEAYTATSDEKYLKDAIKLYEDFIAKSSSVEVGAMNNLAYLLADKNIDVDKAVEYAKKAYDVIQNNPNILDTYAYVLYKKGDYKKASEIIQSALQLFEKDRMSADPAAYEHSGMINAKLGRKAEALNAYNQALKNGEKTLSEQDKQRIKGEIQAIK